MVDSVVGMNIIDQHGLKGLRKSTIYCRIQEERLGVMVIMMVCIGLPNYSITAKWRYDKTEVISRCEFLAEETRWNGDYKGIQPLSSLCFVSTDF